MCSPVMKLFIAAIVLILIGFSACVYHTAHAYSLQELKHRVPQNQYPDIPKCDKELWLRITEGCGDVDTDD